MSIVKNEFAIRDKTIATQGKTIASLTKDNASQSNTIANQSSAIAELRQLLKQAGIAIPSNLNKTEKYFEYHFLFNYKRFLQNDGGIF